MAGPRALQAVREVGAGAWLPWGGARVRSLRCLSTCSGRGVCDHASRTCRCDAFWMQSLLAQLDPDAMPDCGNYCITLLWNIYYCLYVWKQLASIAMERVMYGSMY